MREKNPRRLSRASDSFWPREFFEFLRFHFLARVFTRSVTLARCRMFFRSHARQCNNNIRKIVAEIAIIKRRQQNKIFIYIYIYTRADLWRNLVVRTFYVRLYRTDARVTLHVITRATGRASVCFFFESSCLFVRVRRVVRNFRDRASDARHRTR